MVNPKIGEREILSAILEVDADLLTARDAILLITDKGFVAAEFEKELAEQGIELLRPLLRKVRQLIESVNDTLKGQLDLEQCGGHNNLIGAPVTRSLMAYDHQSIRIYASSSRRPPGRGPP